MYNQIETILSQYELEIQQTTKGRDAYICTTNKGIKTLVAFRGSTEKGEFLKNYLRELERNGFPVEQIVENKNGKAITECEATGERFLVKDYTKGTELNMARLEELIAAMELLADYRQAAEKVQIEVPAMLKENVSSIVEVRQRRCLELTKVKNYIRGRKKKNEFDQVFLKAYDDMMSTAVMSLAQFEKEKNMESGFGICHNDYNQHNILKTEAGWRLVNFEHFSYGCVLLDFVNFLRKTMEKHNWDVELGRTLINAYRQRCEFGKAEEQRLYGILLFPEKFWKISNHYMNSRKSWISERDIEKMEKVVAQEAARKKFLENIFSISS